MSDSTTSITHSPLRSSAPLAPSMPVRRKTGPEERSLRDYIFMLRRRWLLVSVIAALVFVIAVGIIMTLPALYRADVLVVLQPPSVTTSHGVVVQPEISKKLDALREQVESRRVIAEIVRKYDLYSASRGVIPQDELFELVRKSITLKLGKSSFNLYFDHPDPQTAANVANELARYYIEENTRIRRESLQNTERFINTQIERLEKEVREQEAQLKEFRIKYGGSLPENVETNQTLLQALTLQVSAAENRLQGELLRKRQIEERISELVANEIDQKTRAVAGSQAILKKFPNIPEGDSVGMEDSPPERSATAATGNKEEAEPDEGRGGRRPLFQEMQAEVDADSGIGSAEDVELEMLRETLRLRETAVRESLRNVKDLEGLMARNVVAPIQVNNARNELDKRKGELRIQRAQALRTRAKYIEQVRSNEEALWGLKEFQEHWKTMMAKLQDIEAQRLRITRDAPDDVIKSSSTRIAAINSEIADLRKRQTSMKALAKGDLAMQVYEHQNLMSMVEEQHHEVRQNRERMADLERKLRRSVEVQVLLPEILRKHKTAVEQYENMLRQRAQAELAISVEINQEGERMVIWDPAIPTSLPYKPKYALLFGGSLVFALGCGAALALLLELLSPKYLNADGLQEQTAMNVVAQFDLVPGRDFSGPLPAGVPASCGKVITLHNPRHRVAKQFFDCACLLFKPASQWPRVVAVCSPISGDGKTFVATNLAAAIAMSSREPTLLVDANLRSPNLHTLFDKPQNGGLAEALEGQPVCVHPIPGAQPCDLQVLTAGNVQRHGAVLLGSTRFQQMMEKLSYEGRKPRIILDTPSLQAGADVDVLLDGVDGVILVVRRGHTATADVERALRRIPANKLLGIVFNANRPG